MSENETRVNDEPPVGSLREVLAGYDSRIDQALSEVLGTTTGTERVQALRFLSKMVLAHDSVLGLTLCPLLEALPGGADVAERLRKGCDERSALLSSFQSLAQGTAARNVYPVFGEQIETILAALQLSFKRHVEDETTRVSELLDSATAGVAPDVVAARMALEENRAPLRAHQLARRHPRSKILRAIYRGVDRMHDWNDSHHGWQWSRHRTSLESIRPAHQPIAGPPSLLGLLSAYDSHVEAFVAELAEAGKGGPQRAAAAYRLAAAIAVHDSIVGGSLCRLLDEVEEGHQAAATLRKGCNERATLLRDWDDLVKSSSPAQLFEVHSVEADTIVDRLISSFKAHETHETDIVSGVVERLGSGSWRFQGTASPNLLWAWGGPSPKPDVLAAHMAVWADKAPTRSHPLLSRHPTNWLLRDLYHRADQIRDWRRARQGWPALK